MKNSKVFILKKTIYKMKKGVSPVIATVLLISMVIVLGLIIFLWFRGMIVEEGTKFGKNVKLVCEDVNFKASYSEGILSIVNLGNTPIFNMHLRIFEGKGYDTLDLKEKYPEDWEGLNSGGTFSQQIDGEVGNADKLTLIPILRAKSSKGEIPYICGDEYAREVEGI